ncbi:MAG TPA: NFACT family protein, partial [Bacillota bacterium]|nr:NFACT family protein [Bacillota bacterium]
MPFDGFTMRCLVLELEKRILNGRIEKIYQPRQDTLIFHINTGSGREKLLISANPSNPRIHLTAESDSSAQHPPMFCMLLRKRLNGGTILSIRQHGMDRVLELAVKTTDQLGEPGLMRIVCEVMGRQSNIILLEQDGRITDSIKRVTGDMSSYRHIFPGIQYKSPPSQSKLDISCA